MPGAANASDVLWLTMPEPAPQDYSLVRDAVVLLLAAIIVVPLFRRFGINSVIGYLVAGVAIGPHGLALIRELEGTHRLAELGVVFMLFAVGLELSPERLRVMARYVFGLGVAQVATTGAILAGGALSVRSRVGAGCRHRRSACVVLDSLRPSTPFSKRRTLHAFRPGNPFGAASPGLGRCRAWRL